MGSQEPKRLHDEDEQEAIVIPIHGKTYTPPAPREIDEPITRRPSAPVVPIADRPWRLLIVPPTPGAPTRAINVRRWQAKLAAFAIGALALLAGLDIVAVVFALKGQDPVPSAEEEDALRNGLLAVEDSIAVAKQLRDAQLEYERDSATAVAIAGPKASAKLLEARKRMLESRKTLALHTYHAPVAAPVSTVTSEIENFPLIGAISSVFAAARRHPLLHYLRPHNGVDVAANYGTRITAPASGKVTFVGKRMGYGNVVEMDHGNGITTLYAHASSVLVREGQQVTRGQLIATVGSTGLATGPHLHYEVKVNGKNVDPLKFRMPQPADSSAASGTAIPDAPSTPNAPPPQTP